VNLTRTAAILVAAVATLAGSQPAREPALLIRNVTIISMGSVPVIGFVVVRDGRIVEVGTTSGGNVTGATVIDGTGKFLIPGLIDMHTHVSKTRGSSLALLVAHGITTVRDMGGDHDELLRWKADVIARRRVGPRLLIAGPYLESAANATRQHNTPATEMIEPVERTRIGVAAPSDAERIVAQIAARGVDHLKIRTTQDRETYLAIGAAARRHGLALTGHWQPYGFEALFAAGQRSIEHAFYPPLEIAPAERRTQFERMAQAGIAVIPTLVVLERMGTPTDRELRAIVDATEHPVNGKRYLAAFTRADWREQLAEQGGDRHDVFTRAQAVAVRDLREMRTAGVRILAGTDIGVLNVLPGQALHEELALLVRDAGFTPSDALKAATADAAAFLGLADTGTVARGNRADLVLLDGNPLEDIGRVANISGVVLNGRWLDRAALNQLVDGVAASPDVGTNDWPRKVGR
jgi:imidazolonepropionase-like amidohydrolase